MIQHLKVIMGNQLNYSTDRTIINHPVFERSSLVKANKFMKVQFSIDNEKEVDIWERNLSKLKSQLDGSQELLIPHSFELSEKGFCGNSCVLAIYYQAYPYVLQDQIMNRIKNKSQGQFFEESQLWYLLYRLLSAANNFSRLYGTKVGDIRPHNIFMSQDGQLKVANLLSWPSGTTNYEKSLYDRQTTFVSPEEMKSFISHNLEYAEESKFELCESFSIGLTILQAGLIFDFSQLYNMRTFKMDFEKFREKFREWKQLKRYSEEANGYVEYSQNLKLVILKLCELEPENRALSLEIHKCLIPYEKEILNFRDFEILSPLEFSYSNSRQTMSPSNADFISTKRKQPYSNLAQKQKKENISAWHDLNRQNFSALPPIHQNISQDSLNRWKQGVQFQNIVKQSSVSADIIVKKSDFGRDNFKTSNLMRLEDLSTEQKQVTNSVKPTIELATDPNTFKISDFPHNFGKTATWNINKASTALQRNITQINTTGPPPIIPINNRDVNSGYNNLQEIKEVTSLYRPEDSKNQSLSIREGPSSINIANKREIQWKHSTTSSDMLRKIDQQLERSKRLYQGQ